MKDVTNNEPRFAWEASKIPKRATLFSCFAMGFLAFLAGVTQSRGQDRKDRWGADYFPDYVLTDQDGKSQRFFTDLIKDKIVVINFIYTSCPDTCPLETSRLREVYSFLEERMGQDIFFYSITIDPERDTVKTLKEYANRWSIGKGWSFLTGSEKEISDLRRKLGLLSVRDSVNLSDHQINMVMGNQKTGRWIHRTPFDTPAVLAEHLGSWLNNYRNIKDRWNDYADAPELRNQDGGEYIFRTRCASCHTIGGGDVRNPRFAAAGPDLFGVHLRRDPKWLARWVREPDLMLAEGDELAHSLLKQYNGLAMPNFRLSEADVDRVLAFIKRETDRQLAGHPSDYKHDQESLPLTPPEARGCPGCAKSAIASPSSTIVKPRTWVPERPNLAPNNPSSN